MTRSLNREQEPIYSLGLSEDNQFDFTDRQQDVIQHILSGEPTGSADIAEALHIEPQTAKNHILDIFDKVEDNTGTRPLSKIELINTLIRSKQIELHEADK